MPYRGSVARAPKKSAAWKYGYIKNLELRLYSPVHMRDVSYMAEGMVVNLGVYGDPAKTLVVRIYITECGENHIRTLVVLMVKVFPLWFGD